MQHLVTLVLRAADDCGTIVVEERLAELESLKNRGLVSEAEYADRRTAILGSL